jgi:phosphoglycerol transferase MdoB-like AlkP superfamily enzyme
MRAASDHQQREVSRSQLVYFASAVFIFEIFKWFNGQSILEGLLKLGFFTSVFIACHFLMRLFGFVCLLFEASESAAWYFTQSGFNVQALMALDLTWTLRHHPELLWLLAGLVAFLGFLAFFPSFPNSHPIVFGHYFWFFPVIAILSAFNVGQYLKWHMDPFHSEGRLNRGIEKALVKPLETFFLEPQNASFRDPSTKKNLILIEIESLEQQLLGSHNHFFPESMPYISALSQNSTFADHVVSSPYTTWSVASMFACQCNLPLLMITRAAYNSANFHLLPQHRCLGDILHSLGYHLFSFMTNVFLGRFKAQLGKHHFRTFDVKEHGLTRDWDLMELIGDRWLANLSRRANQPFFLHIATADTHPFPHFIVDERCEDRVPNYPRILRSFDCVDQIIERFMVKLAKSPLAKNTEVFVYGDHLLMSGTYGAVRFFDPRYMVALFPTGPKKLVSKKSSIYDFAPTLLEVMGIEVYPPFPFGTSLFNEKVGMVPEPAHLQYIYDFFGNSMQWNQTAQCVVGKTRFCRMT